VLSGAGETTCANTRCEHHHPTSPIPLLSPTRSGESPPEVPLSTLELPFAYEEHGEQKSALVKVVLCDRCVRKLMYKRNKEKEKAMKMQKERERAARGGDDDNDNDGNGSEEGRKRKKGMSKDVAEGSATGEDKGRDRKRQEDHSKNYPHSSQTSSHKR
jgi:protein FRA10AC1